MIYVSTGYFKNDQAKHIIKLFGEALRLEKNSNKWQKVATKSKLKNKRKKSLVDS